MTPVIKGKRTKRVGHQTHLTNVKDALEINSRNFIPWRVTFQWYNSQLDLRSTNAVFFVRAPNPSIAGVWASKLWHHWTRGRLDPFTKFPKMEDAAAVERIDDITYMDELSKAKRLTKKAELLLLAGHPDNPKAFWPREICENSLIVNG